MRHLIPTLLLSLFSLPALAGTDIKPTTTLAAETASNTSAASSFAGQRNGNMGAANISKLPIRNLLYQGSTTRLYAHLMPWFGGSNHVSVGYNSADKAQATRQVNDMVSRGIDGLIIDWYGPTATRENTASLNLLAAAQNVPNFELAIMEDISAIRSAADPAAKLISDLNYVWANFAQSPVYMRRNGRPVVFFFGVESMGLDLVAVKSKLTWNPLFIFENDNAFTMSSSDGAFSWLAPITTNYASYTSLAYLDDFYWNALRNPSKLTFGSGFKGFNDIIASWAPPGGRHIEQFCGQTWLNSMKRAGKSYSASNQLANLQLVTWNDYEEGTALEPGIDNCLSISASVSGDTLRWAINGQENTLDHYQVFISKDGMNLMPLTTVGTGTYAHDLAQYKFANGSYQLFVQAVGQPTIVNHFSAAANYTVAVNTGPSPPGSGDNSGTSTSATDFAVTPTAPAVNVQRGASTTVPLSVSGVNGSFNRAVAFACSGLPAAMTCSFSPGTVTPGSTSANTVLTINTATTQLASARRHSSRGFGFIDPTFYLLGLAIAGTASRKRKTTSRRIQFAPSGIVIACAATATLLAMLACGGGATTQAPSPTTTMTAQGSYTIQVVSTSGATQHTSNVTITVN